MQITVTMNEHDAARLITSGYQWRGENGQEGLSQYADQYEVYMPHGDVFKDPETHWVNFYTLGESYTAVIFMRAYLDSIGEGYEILWDCDSDWCVVTNARIEKWGDWSWTVDRDQASK